MVRIPALVATLSAALALSAAPGAGAPPAAARQPVSRHLLDGGLVVLVKESRSSDLVVIEAVVDAGPRVERHDESGITFFARSMLVRGTASRSAAEIAQTIEGVGGLLGGGTGTDFTSLYVVTPSRHLGVGMELLADLLTNARFEVRDVEVQRSIGLSRIRQNADQPLQRATDLMLEALYPYHPYSQPVLGYEATVAALTREQLIQFYRTHFTAPNMVLSIAGNVTRSAALDAAGRAFKGLRREPPPRRSRWLRLVERALATPAGTAVEVRETRPVAASWISLGYLAVPVGHPDFAALRVMNALLGEGMSSRLFVQIREKGGMAYQVGSSLPVRSGPSHIRLIAGTDPANTSKVVGAMLAEVERLRAAAPPLEEVEAAKRGVVGRYALSREDLEAQAFYLGWYEILGVGFDYDERFPREIEKVTPEDVARVARRYLGRQTVAIVGPASAR